ncbi:flavin-containing protein [Fusarium sp. NRRL 52700]|nr:flavin-containing protein [Fusarium sp. NRRL 52700]
MVYDVVVIGAGLSGLQAAYSAKQAGLSIAIVEARERPGGKVWSVPLASGRGLADLGAAWINDQLQPRVTAYINQFGLKTIKQAVEGTAITQVSKNERVEFPLGIVPDFDPAEKENLIKIRDIIQEASLRKEKPRPEDDAISLEQYVRNLGATEKTVQMAHVWTRAMHGKEASEESAAYFIDYCRSNHGLLAVRADDKTGGNYQRLVNGTLDIACGIARLVGEENIFYNEPVVSINDQEKHVTVTTTTGKAFASNKVIISIPSAMFRELTFKPQLPARLKEITDNATLGHYNKAIVCYDRPWWKDLGYNGFFFSYVGPISIARDTSVPEKGLYALTCFVNGKPGEEWSKLRPHDRRRTVLEQLANVYNVGPESELWRPIEIFDQVWQHETYSRGALAPIPALGHYTKFADVYGKPVGNIHFVGTEYSNHWKGYMEGALNSGDIGAQEVIQALSQVPRAHL